MPFAISDLITPVSQADVMNTLLSIAAAVGLPTTTWQSGNPIRTILSTVAQKVSDLSVVATQMTQGGFGDLVSTDEWADAWSQSIYNVTRIVATQATGLVNITASSSAATTSYNPGELIFAHATTGQTYRNVASVSIVTSTTTSGVPVIADVAGTIANAVTAAVSLMVSTQVGLSVTNPASILGTDKETTPALVVRARRKLGSLSPNGPKDAYDFVATSLTTLTSAITRTNTTASGGAVSVYIANASGVVPAPDVALVQAAIDTFATPWAVTATAIAATPLVIPVTYQVWTRGAALTSAQMQTVIASALATFFASLRIGGDVVPPDSGAVYIDAIQTAIANAAPGIRRVVVSDPAATVALTPNQVAVLGTLTGTVTALS